MFSIWLRYEHGKGFNRHRWYEILTYRFLGIPFFVRKKEIH